MNFYAINHVSVITESMRKAVKYLKMIDNNTLYCTKLNHIDEVRH